MFRVAYSVLLQPIAGHAKSQLQKTGRFRCVQCLHPQYFSGGCEDVSYVSPYEQVIRITLNNFTIQKKT
jgi:hypothetical protein